MNDRPLSADERLRRAAERLKAANAELDAAEREHGEAVAQVEAAEKRSCTCADFDGFVTCPVHI